MSSITLTYATLVFPVFALTLMSGTHFIEHSAVMAVNLTPFPYFSQNDNEIEPARTSGVTSAAMCLAYFEVPDFGSFKQYEDDVMNRFDNLGLDHGVPNDIKRLIEAFGLRDNLTLSGRNSDIITAIDSGSPCILHGHFTGPGHIIVVRGYTSNGDFIVNDPEGEWFYGGYQRNRSSGPDTKGENKIYSRRLISAAGNAFSLRQALTFYDTWSADQIESTATLWLHRITK